MSPDKGDVAVDPLRVALIGPGLIGSDLLMKIGRCPWLRCTVVIGRSSESGALWRAKARGYEVSDGGVTALDSYKSEYDLVFDATNSSSHAQNWEAVQSLNKRIIDLTPSGIGRMIVPAINGSESIQHRNISLISCGAQVCLPIAAACARRFEGIEYIEIVTTAASLSVGPATRLNLDEYIETTEMAVGAFTGIPHVKALINISAAHPPVDFRVGLSFIVNKVNLSDVNESANQAVSSMRSYAPGLQISSSTLLSDNIAFIALQLKGRGDVLPAYAGNLDIINDAAVKTARYIYDDTRDNRLGSRALTNE